MSWFDLPDYLERREVQTKKDLEQAKQMRELKCPGSTIENVFYQQKLSNQERSKFHTSWRNLPDNVLECLKSVDQEQKVLGEVLDSGETSGEKCRRLAGLRLVKEEK